MAQDVEAAHAGQHHVEHHQPIVAGERAIDGARAVGFDLEREILAREVFADQVAELGVVVHEQDPNGPARRVRQRREHVVHRPGDSGGSEPLGATGR